MKYKVKVPFTYEGEKYKVGDEWTPAGCLHDGKIINQGRLVAEVESPTATKGKRKVKEAAAQLQFFGETKEAVNG